MTDHSYEGAYAAWQAELREAARRPEPDDRRPTSHAPRTVASTGHGGLVAPAARVQGRCARSVATPGAIVTMTVLVVMILVVMHDRGSPIVYA